VRSRVALLILFALATLSCARPQTPPNVLVIVVDTLRADRLGAYGNTRGLTPFLDQLAQRGTTFLNAYAPSSWTIPSVASLLTSRYASQHRVVGFGSKLPPAEVTFAEAMQPLRYVAGGFSANFQLVERYGFAQGFQHWRADQKMPGGLSAAELRQQALEWLDQSWDAQRPQPALLYFQFMEPHFPYDPPEPYRTQALDGEQPDVLTAAAWEKVQKQGRDALTRHDLRGFERLYDGEVACTDAEIKVLFEELQRRGFLDHAIVIITSDHGEEFFEHHETQHGKTLFDESVRVPFLLIAPGYRGGHRVEERVSLVDVAPTLIELLGLSSNPRFEGRSLVPLLDSTSSVGRLAAWTRRLRWTSADVILELKPKSGTTFDNRKHVDGIIRDSVKLVITRSGARETYDLASDPAEAQANPATLDAMAATLATALEDTNTRLSSRAESAMTEELDSGTKEKLRALGYQL
jgi:arylsulfatase A-like enzyme